MQGHPNTEGYGWYRLHTNLDPAQREPQKLAVFFPYVRDAYELYWNGGLVGSNGKLPPPLVWPTPAKCGTKSGDAVGTKRGIKWAQWM
jgi:hypothetical protein